MDINFSGKYKSILNVDWQGIPMLAVITGANGSGKTQLLELIARRANAQLPGISRDQQATLQMIEGFLQCSIPLHPNNTVMLGSNWELGQTSASLMEFRDLAAEAFSSQGAKEQLRDQKMRGREPDTRWNRLWEELAKQSGIERGDFSRAQFNELLPPNFPLLRDNFGYGLELHRAVPILFVSYAAKIAELQRDGLDSEEIYNRVGRLPWDAVNESLAQAGLKYKIAPPAIPKSSGPRISNCNTRCILRCQTINASPLTPYPPVNVSFFSRQFGHSYSALKLCNHKQPCYCLMNRMPTCTLH